MTPRRILLVEDEEVLRRQLRDILEEEGYEVREAEDGNAAKQLLQSAGEYFDLVLTDVKMPNCDGMEFVGWMDNEGFGFLPVLVMSGAMEAPQDALLRLFMQKGLVKAFLQKPFVPSALKSALMAAGF